MLRRPTCSGNAIDDQKATNQSKEYGRRWLSCSGRRAHDGSRGSEPWMLTLHWKGSDHVLDRYRSSNDSSTKVRLRIHLIRKLSLHPPVQVSRFQCA
jgi:hypothetical protein